MTNEEAARQLETDKDYRVLRRVPPVDLWGLRPAEGETIRACVVDCESTGIGDSDEVIELACRRMLPIERHRRG